jgi:hypothetical protein
LISINANIYVPAGYNPTFDTTSRDTVIPICDLRAVALVIQTGKVEEFLNLLRRSYQGLVIQSIPCSCNIAILEALVNYKCDAFSNNNVYEIGVSAIDRSYNPIRGRIVAYDSQLMWIQDANPNLTSTFYIVPLTYISFIIK